MMENNVEIVEEEKKTRSSPSKKVALFEERMDLFQQELQALRDYVRRLEDHYIYKISPTLPDPPTSILPRVNMHKVNKRKRTKTIEEEPALELTENVEKIEKEPVKKKRGRPKKSK